ncbi:MAG: HEAT repeat domain-containing protein [Puia sp.]|nr:HEAT repeat domain-containing protein [Puia sp.]
MDCAAYKEQITLLTTGALDDRGRQDLEKHIDGCPGCQAEFEATRKLWDLMGEIPDPVPPASMRARFHSALHDYSKERATENPLFPASNIMRRLWSSLPRFQFGYGILLLVIGLFIGYLLNHHPQTGRDAQTGSPSPTGSTSQTAGSSTAGSSQATPSSQTPTPAITPAPSQMPMSLNKQIDSLSSQVSEMKQMMMLSLLENPSASQRIRAVGYTDEIGSANKKVIDALLATLNEDPNVNVRLITLEALSKYSKDPRVRQGLVQSITRQESPLLQSAIADVMVKLQEKRSIKPLQTLLDKKDLNEMVKTKIEQSIRKLI